MSGTQTEESSARARCMRFHERILGRTTSAPKDDFPALCDAWREATNADWVWMWMYNDHTSEWELIACNTGFDRGAISHEAFEWPDLNSASEYVNQTELPEYVDDIENWHATYKDKQYHVACAQRLTDLGCAAFDTIPLLPPHDIIEDVDEYSDMNVPIRGAVCLHYKDERKRVPLPEDSLLLMGRLTALVARSSYQADHRDILVYLNRLAEKHLTAIRRRPAQVRQEYVDEVISLVKESLCVRAVSIFYQVPFANEIECLGTTGLGSPSDEGVISKEGWSNVTYMMDEGLTGSCFASGKPHIRVKDAPDDHSAKWVEILVDRPLRKIGTCFYPIPKPPYEKEEDGPKSLGVLRCAGHYSPFLDSFVRSFDPTDMRKLGFISRQIAPVLHTMALRVQREMTIEIVKHDLQTPLNMIRDIAEEMEICLHSYQSIQKYDVINLQTSVSFAQNFLHQLDPNPFEIPELVAEQTSLEGVIARVRHMLQHFAKEESDMSIVFNGFRGLGTMYIERLLIERVFWNLLVNGIKYGKKGSEIEVLARGTNDGVYVDIKNYGIGVDSTEVKFIFNPHYRSPRAKSRKQGLGLGLSIAKKAMEKHDGTLELLRSNEPTVFRLFFPSRLKSKGWQR